MARSAGTRQDTFQILVHLNGNSLGQWDKKTGGEVDSDENKYYPGGMQPPQDLGGRVTPGNVVLQRLYDRVDDHDKIQTLINAVGKGTVTVSQRPMDPNGNPYGKPIIWTGKLKRVNTPDVDGESSSAALYEIEVSVSNAPVSV